MKIEFVPTAVAALCGGCAVALGKPALAFAAMHIELTCAATSAALLAGAAWIGVPRRARTEPEPAFGAYSAPLSVSAWLAANNVQAGADRTHASAAIQIALRDQLRSSDSSDVRVAALILCLLRAGHSKNGGHELLEELAVAATATDPEGETSRFLARHNLRTDPVLTDLWMEYSARYRFAAAMLLGSLDYARSSGRYSSSAMLWLKQVDRGLWYAVSNLGRGAYHVEGLAAIAHFSAVTAEGGGWLQPRIEAAHRTLLQMHAAREDRVDAPVPEPA